jgi:hypothetical protein
MPKLQAKTDRQQQIMTSSAVNRHSTHACAVTCTFVVAVVVLALVIVLVKICGM